jgi:hypothetical protein
MPPTGRVVAELVNAEDGEERQAAYELAHRRIDTGLAPAQEIAERIIDGMKDLGL